MTNPEAIFTFNKSTSPNRDVLAFLPAVLEVQETPPSPLGRAIVWSIVALFLFAIIWSAFGHVDIVAIAPGKIIPSARVKIIQPVELGRITAIHVNEGQTVQAGEPLITLDATYTQADATRIEKEMHSLQWQMRRLDAYYAFLDKQTDDIFSVFAVAEPEAQYQNRLLRDQINEYQAKHESLQRETERLHAEQRTADALRDKLRKTLPLLKERLDGIAKLTEQHLSARHDYLELQQIYIEQTQELTAQTAKLDALIAAQNGIDAQRKTLLAESRRATLTERAELQRQYTALEQENIKATQRDKQQILTAPISGTVQQLAMHTVGGVVSPAQELLRIVPVEDRLEVEAYLENKDIGFVEIGQNAEVKIETFPFTKYGVIDAEISHINLDAIQDERLGLIYLARVALKQNQMQVGNKIVQLTPGMAVTVEIKTGARRLIEYFLAPLLRYKQESLRER